MKNPACSSGEVECAERRTRRDSSLSSAEPIPFHRTGIDSQADRGRHSKSMSTVAERKGGIGVALLSHRPPEDDGMEESRRRRTQWRNDAAFWLLGLINNSGYVIMMAVAKEIVPGAVGIVFFADVAPTMIIKVTAPYW